VGGSCWLVGQGAIGLHKKTLAQKDSRTATYSDGYLKRLSDGYFCCYLKRLSDGYFQKRLSDGYLGRYLGYFGYFPARDRPSRITNARPLSITNPSIA
jgi:hypothetical protein